MASDKKKELIVRSSAAEYLTFVASAGNSDASFEMRYEDENIWLTQKMMAELYGVSKQSISQHINRIYADGELTPEGTVKKYLTVQTEGKRQVSRNQEHYNLQLIIAVGFKVNNQRAVQFRKWPGRLSKTILFRVGCLHIFSEELNFAHLMLNISVSSDNRE